MWVTFWKVRTGERFFCFWFFWQWVSNDVLHAPSIKEAKVTQVGSSGVTTHSVVKHALNRWYMCNNLEYYVEESTGNLNRSSRFDFF